MVPTSIVENDGKRVSNAGKEDEERKDNKHDTEKHNRETTLREAMDEKLAEAAKDTEHEQGPGRETPNQHPSKSSGTEVEGEDERKRKIRLKNRRKAWIDGHPEYFENQDLELAGKSRSIYDKLSSLPLRAELPGKPYVANPCERIEGVICKCSRLLRCPPSSM